MPDKEIYTVKSQKTSLRRDAAVTNMPWKVTACPGVFAAPFVASLLQGQRLVFWSSADLTTFRGTEK